MTLQKTSAELVTSPVFQWNYSAGQRVVINQGGTSSGKTYSILQVILMRCLQRPRIATVVGQDIPNLKKGALRDFERILDSSPIGAFVTGHNKTDRTYTLSNGSVIEFTSYKDEQDAKSGKRDILFINEANGIPWQVYNQLAMRTGEQIFIDYNPTNSFWVHERLIGQPDTVVFYSNFTHNPFVNPEIVAHVRGYRLTDPESWRVYGLGKTGNIRGLVFRNVRYVPELPPGLKKRCYGMDFGFTNDPTALVEVGELHGELYGRQLIYRLGMTNRDICRELEALGISRAAEIYADSAEPKSIAEIKAEGWNIKPATKGPDSVKHGISVMKKYRLNITADSVEWKKEQQNYKWKEKDGISLNEPVDSWNHCWDACRYAAVMKWGKARPQLPTMA